jgi:hypothetical protein
MNLMRRLLGITKHWGDEEPITLGLTLFNNECNLPPFTPIIIRKIALEQGRERGRSATDVINVFPSIKRHNARSRNTLYSDSIIEVDSKMILENRPLIAVEKFDYKKLERVIGFVKTHGAATYVIENLDGAKSFISNIGLFKKQFKYTAWLGHNSSNPSPETADDKMIMLVSLYDLQYVIPIYNSKRAYGIGGHVCLMWERMTSRDTRIRFADELFFATNQYQDNLLVVDGQSTYKKGFVGNDYISHFRDVIGRESRRQVEAQKRAKMSKKKESKGVAEEKKVSLKDLPVMKSSGNMKSAMSTAYTASNSYYYTTTTS